MEILTRDYGTVEIRESSIIRFSDGIIGFEGYHDYTLLDIEDGSSPFKCLQSTEESSLAFILFDPFIVRPDYEVAIDDEAAARLSIDGNEEIVILAITVISEDIRAMSFNLKAPIVINARENKGIQYIVDNAEYGVRHYLSDEIERAKSMRPEESQTAV